jgi:hypothetical protein
MKFLVKTAYEAATEALLAQASVLFAHTLNITVLSKEHGGAQWALLTREAEQWWLGLDAEESEPVLEAIQEWMTLYNKDAQPRGREPGHYRCVLIAVSDNNTRDQGRHRVLDARTGSLAHTSDDCLEGMLYELRKWVGELKEEQDKRIARSHTQAQRALDECEDGAE